MGLLYGAEQGIQTGLNGDLMGPVWGSCVGLMMVPLSFSHHAGHFDLTGLCMASSSLLNWAPVQGCMGTLNGAIWGSHMGMLLVLLDSSHHANKFDTWLISLWLTVLFWMALLYRAEWGSCMGLNSGWMGPVWGSHTGMILVPKEPSHCANHFDTWLISVWPMVLAQCYPSNPTQPFPGWPSWLQVKLDWPGWWWSLPPEVIHLILDEAWSSPTWVMYHMGTMCCLIYWPHRMSLLLLSFCLGAQGRCCTYQVMQFGYHPKHLT